MSECPEGTHFDRSALDTAFPFGLELDEALRVRRCGPVLLRLLPELATLPALEEHFVQIDRVGPMTRESLAATPLVLRSRRRPRLLLRGVLVPVLVGGERALAFLGSPRVSRADLQELGLDLTDFAAHDAAVDVLELERDVERVQDELRLAQRLEAVGQLAAGIAHEINTPIQYVGDSLYFLRSASEDIVELLERVRGARDVASIDVAWEEADADFLFEQIPKALDRMFDGVERVTKIVKAMKAFAHKGEDRAPADLNEAMTNTLMVARNEYKYVADVDVRLETLPPVVCSVGELNQVFLNLVVNAAHAIADVVHGDERGKITVRSRHEGDAVVLEIEDTGGGIAPEVRERIFDPFFTTKPVGKGTGQGLTLARSIVKKHGGTLTFDSEVGRGTRFAIRLPVGPEASCRI
ncbi:MAG: GHKL domain-containing protein [Deltaproteobacteria bacterium]|nr:GHKL domain-containing protein [Deltaproteobacteria bacterium]